jgi:hypothetical protein
VYNGIKVETMKRDRIKELTMALEQAMQRSPHERLLQLIYNALAAQSQLSPNLHYFHVTDEQLLAALNSYSCEPPQPILQRPFEIVKRAMINLLFLFCFVSIKEVRRIIWDSMQFLAVLVKRLLCGSAAV